MNKYEINILRTSKLETEYDDRKFRINFSKPRLKPSVLIGNRKYLLICVKLSRSES